MQYLIATIVTLNAAAFLLYAYDKAVSKWNKQRVREKWLLLIALVGGSLGAMVAMFLMHHKIAKPEFRYGAFAMFVAHFLLFAWWQGWFPK